jgi:hypothetical protein
LSLWLALFSTMSCVVGGIALVSSPQGNDLLPIERLRFTPFRDYLIPGLILTFVVGGAQLLSATAIFQRNKAAPQANALAGASLTGWVIAEAAMLRVVTLMQAVFLVVGLATLLLGAVEAWRSREPRARWLLLVTAGELVGFVAPALTGIMLAKLDASGPLEVLALGAAGGCEGLLLGAAQAWAWPLPVRRARYALLTAGAAGLVWVCAMSLVQLAGTDGVTQGLVIACAALTVLIGLISIGGAQWLELRHHAPRAWRFVPWTALAWTLALPFSFAPGPFVDESTPLASQVALWTLGGALMAVVMALVTWIGVRRLSEQPSAAQRSLRVRRLRKRILRCCRFDSKDWTRCAPYQAFGNGAHEQVTKPGTTMRAHHNKIGSIFERNAQ